MAQVIILPKSLQYPPYFFPMTICFTVSKDIARVSSQDELDFIIGTEVKRDYVIIGIDSIEKLNAVNQKKKVSKHCNKLIRVFGI